MPEATSTSEQSFSVSRLKLFESCPRKYRFMYIDGVKPDFRIVDSFVGSRVHETLETLYNLLDEESLPALGELVQHYRLLWEKKWHSGIRLTMERGRDWHRRFGEKCIKRYYYRHHPFHEARRTIGVEWKFHFLLDNDRSYSIKGTIDRLTFSEDDEVEVHDYKTSKRKPRHRQLRADLQPGVYQLAAREAFPEAPAVNVKWHFLAFDQEYAPTRSLSSLEELKDELVRRIDEVRESSTFPPRPGKHCRWCEYAHLCRQEGGAQ